jgi:hypothetical protein
VNPLLAWGLIFWTLITSPLFWRTCGYFAALGTACLVLGRACDALLDWLDRRS